MVDLFQRVSPSGPFSDAPGPVVVRQGAAWQSLPPSNGAGGSVAFPLWRSEQQIFASSPDIAVSENGVTVLSAGRWLFCWEGIFAGFDPEPTREITWGWVRFERIGTDLFSPVAPGLNSVLAEAFAAPQFVTSSLLLDCEVGDVVIFAGQVADGGGITCTGYGVQMQAFPVGGVVL